MLSVVKKICKFVFKQIESLFQETLYSNSNYDLQYVGLNIISEIFDLNHWVDIKLHYALEDRDCCLNCLLVPVINYSDKHKREWVDSRGQLVIRARQGNRSLKQLVTSQPQSVGKLE